MKRLLAILRRRAKPEHSPEEFDFGLLTRLREAGL